MNNIHLMANRAIAVNNYLFTVNIPLCLSAILLCQCITTEHFSSNASSNGGSKQKRLPPEEQRVYETIMADYKSFVMPYFAPDINSTPLRVDFSLKLNQIVSLDERQQVLTINVFIDQTWTDPALAWDQANFTHVRALRIPSHNVWLPDTFLYNNADEGTSGFMQGTYVKIQNKGRVLWPVPLRLRSSCSVQITYFPFDSQMKTCAIVQQFVLRPAFFRLKTAMCNIGAMRKNEDRRMAKATCVLRFGSWIYDIEHLDYTWFINGLTVDMTTYVNNSEWELSAVILDKEITSLDIMDGLQDAGLHSYLIYTLHLKRNTFYYLFNIIVPCAMLSTLNMMTFWLPPVSGEKITLGLSVFLAFSMFMLLIAEEVPATSEAVPLIGIYLCMVMTLTSLSVIMAVVVTNLYHKGLKMRPAPRWLDTILIKWFARFVLVTDDIEVFTQFVELTEIQLFQLQHERNDQSVPDQHHATTDVINHLQTAFVSQELYHRPMKGQSHDCRLSRCQNPPSTVNSYNSCVTHRKAGGKKRKPNGKNYNTIIHQLNSMDKNNFPVQPTSTRTESNIELTSSWKCRDTQEENTLRQQPFDNAHNDESKYDNVKNDVWIKISDMHWDERDHTYGEIYNPNHYNEHGRFDNVKRTELGTGMPIEDHIPLQSLTTTTAHTVSCDRMEASLFDPQKRHHNYVGDHGTVTKVKTQQVSIGQQPIFVRTTNTGKDGRHAATDKKAAKIIIAEWQLIATVVDRMMFLVYFVTTILAYLFILIVVPASQSPFSLYSTNETGFDRKIIHQWTN